jgi:hypothetical protein
MAVLARTMEILQQLVDELESAMITACLGSIDKHQGETFYSVSLYTSGEYGYFFDSIATLEGLKCAAERYLDNEEFRDEWKTLAKAMRELKWSPCDLPYHCEFKKNFARVNQMIQEIWQSVEDSDEAFLETCEGIHEAGVVVLSSIKNSRIFDPHDVVFNILKGDQCDEERVAIAAHLNSKEVVERFKLDLEP